MSHDTTKPTKWLCAQQKLRAAWASAQSLLSTWSKLGTLVTHWVHSEDSDQTGRMPRLIWVFAGHTPILRVLSCHGSYYICTVWNLILPNSKWLVYLLDHMCEDGWVRVLRPFNSISVISRRWKGEHERLCAVKRRLGLGRISPPAGFEPVTLWSEVGSANRSATRTLPHVREVPFLRQLFFKI